MLDKEEIERQFVDEFNYAYEDDDHLVIRKFDDLVYRAKIDRFYDRINHKIMIALKSGQKINWLQDDFFRTEFIFNRLGLIEPGDEITIFANCRIDSIDQALKMLKTVEKVYTEMTTQYNSHSDEYIITDGETYRFTDKITEKDPGSLLVDQFESLLKELHKAFISIENNQMVGNKYTVIPTDCRLETGALIVRNSDLITISIRKPSSVIKDIDKRFKNALDTLPEQIANKDLNQVANR